MSWNRPRPYEPYLYTVNILSCIAASNSHIYQGIEFYRKGLYRYTVTNPLLIAEYVADFDTALESLSYRRQKVIEAYMEGVDDFELEGKGYYEVAKFRGSSLRKMADYLNNGG